MNKTTLLKIGAALSSALTTLAVLPYQLGDIATIIPAEWKAKVTLVGIIATAILRVLGQTVPQPK